MEAAVEVRRALHVPKFLDPPSAMGLVEDGEELLTILDALPRDRPAALKRRPRGLQIGVQEPEGGFGTLRRRSDALPGPSHLLPPLPMPGVLPSVSAQGD